jgi:hypothetical protein
LGENALSLITCKPILDTKMGVNILLDTKGNSFCEMCFVFLKKNWVCGESQTILLRVHIDPDISSQNQTSNKNSESLQMNSRSACPIKERNQMS